MSETVVANKNVASLITYSDPAKVHLGVGNPKKYFEGVSLAVSSHEKYFIEFLTNSASLSELSLDQTAVLKKWNVIVDHSIVQREYKRPAIRLSQEEYASLNRSSKIEQQQKLDVKLPSHLIERTFRITESNFRKNSIFDPLSGVLFPVHFDETRENESQRSEALSKSREEQWDRAFSDLVLNGATFIPQLFTQDLSAALIEYYGQLKDGGLMTLGDRDSKKRAWCNNDMVARTIGSMLKPTLEARISEKLKFLFASFVTYNPGADLPLHNDYDPNAISLSIQLESRLFENRCENDWPFIVYGNNELERKHSFLPQIGDAVVFHGFHQPHERTKLDKNRTSDILLIHFTKEGSRL